MGNQASKVSRLMASILICAFSALLAQTFSTAYADVVYDAAPPEASETNLPLFLWQDRSQPARGVVLLIHGISQRSYTLRSLADTLASKGYKTYGLDLRGHGWWRHGRTKRDAGFSSNYKQSVSDANAVVRLLKKKHAEQPLFIIGESVGAGVALRAASQYPDNVNGLVLCGAGNKVSRTSFRWVIKDFLARSFLRKPVDIVRYQKRYGTDDLVALEETIDDPLQRKTFSIRELWRARGCCSKNIKFAKKLDPRTPVLVVQGEDDHIFSLKSGRKVFEALPGRDKQIVVVPKCGHILLGTPRPKPLVTNSIVSFIDQRTQSSIADSGDGNTDDTL